MNHITSLINKVPQLDFSSTSKTCGNITVISVIALVPLVIIGCSLKGKPDENNKTKPLFERIKNNPLDAYCYIIGSILLIDTIVLTTVAAATSLLNRVKKLQ